MIKLLPRFVVTAALASLFATTAFADPGINLSWNDCGSTGVSNKAFACAANTGAESMYASFIPPAGINQFLGMSAVVDFTSSSGLIPSWWDAGSTGCRAGRVSANFSFVAGPFTCADFWAGGASGGFQYQSPFDSTNEQSVATALAVNHSRMKVICAISELNAAPIDASTEYYEFSVTITNQLTTGGGACLGCLIPMCIVFNSTLLAQPAGVGDNTLSAPPTGGNNVVTWQGTAADCNAVPVKNRTWGQVKSLYR